MRTNSRLALASSLLAITLVGCSADQVTNANDASNISATFSNAMQTERPWKGDCDVAAVFTSATELLITGTCELSHLGHTTIVAYQTIDPNSFPIAYTNVTTYTAANGDELRTTDVGTATPNADGLTLSGSVTAVGGTGRFAAAGGLAELNGAVRFTGPASTAGRYSLAGHLVY